MDNNKLQITNNKVTELSEGARLDLYSLNSNSYLSLSKKLSQKYRDDTNNKQISLLKSKISSTDLLFYKREKELLDKFTLIETQGEKLQQTGQIMNDFLFELQKLLGVKNPQNLVENINKVDPEDLIKKLQKIYRIVHKKINNKNDSSLTTKDNAEAPIIYPAYDHRERIILKIILENCLIDTAYKITAYDYFDHFKDNSIIAESLDEIPNSKGKIEFHMNFEVKLYFERRQYVLFKILKKNTNKVYTVKYPISKIIREKEGVIKLEFDKITKETIVIKAHIEQKPRKRVHLKLEMIMEIPDYKSNFCYLLKREESEGQRIKDMISIYKSENKRFPKNEHQINFNTFGSSSNAICLGNLDSEIVLLVYNDSEKKLVVDTHRTSINKLIENPKIVIDQNLIILVNIELLNEYSFCEYLKKDLEINMCLAIDFTKSNGNPHQAGSLHELNEFSDNPYEKAIKCCGEIIAQYDTDKIYPCFGYGAILPNQKDVSHCFNLNLKDDPNINGLDQVMKFYNEAIRKLKFKDPTHFSNIIEKIVEMTVEDKNKEKFVYNILVIMTDGKMEDFNETVNSIVKASEYPISIIIVGIGQNKFENMNVLADDNNRLVDQNGKSALRDIVKFLPYIKYENNVPELAEQIFNEVPRQIVEYFSMNHISPDSYNKNF